MKSEAFAGESLLTILLSEQTVRRMKRNIELRSTERRNFIIEELFFYLFRSDFAGCAQVQGMATLSIFYWESIMLKVAFPGKKKINCKLIID